MLQTLINGLIIGSIYALIASGYSLVYSIQQFFYIAHGAVITSGAFAFYTFLVLWDWPILGAALGAVAIAASLGGLIEITVHRTLRDRDSTALLLFLASTAVFTLLQSVILLIFGPSVKTLGLPLQDSLRIGSALITPTQIIILGAALCALLLLYFGLRRTKFGTALRAVSDDPLAAQTVGISPEQMYGLATVISALLGGVAGIALSLEQDVQFNMGLNAILMGIIASIIGGIDKPLASIFGGFLLGIVENFSTWFLPPGYEGVVTFSLLVIFLTIRPQGLFGSKDNF